MLAWTIIVAVTAALPSRAAAMSRQVRLRRSGVFTINRADHNSVCAAIAARLCLWAPRHAGRITLLDDGVF